MFKNLIESYTGYIQIQNEDFRDNATVDNSFSLTPEIRQIVFKNKNVTDIIPRLESFALASSGSLTKGVLVMGIEPEKETLLSNVKVRLVNYRISAKAIENLKKENLPQKITSKLDLYKDESYSSESVLQMELGISDKEAASIMPVIKQMSSFSNGYISSGKQEALIGDRLSKSTVLLVCSHH